MTDQQWKDRYGDTHIRTDAMVPSSHDIIIPGDPSESGKQKWSVTVWSWIFRIIHRF